MGAGAADAAAAAHAASARRVRFAPANMNALRIVTQPLYPYGNKNVNCYDASQQQFMIFLPA
jgi:hypothetical protein